MANRLNAILNQQESILKRGRGTGYKTVASHWEISEIYKAANGLCAICSSERGTHNHSLDHDHATGKLRGILCHNCNVGLGHFKDDTALMHKAIAYLESYKA